MDNLKEVEMQNVFKKYYILCFFKYQKLQVSLKALTSTVRINLIEAVSTLFLLLSFFVVVG